MDKTIEQLIEERDKLHIELVKVDISNGAEFIKIAAKLQPIYNMMKKLGYSPYTQKEDLQ